MKKDLHSIEPKVIIKRTGSLYSRRNYYKGRNMAKSNNQKAKILYLERMLRETGEDHVVTMKEILTFLQEKGICAERKSIYDDMDVLRSMGMCITFRRERPSGYYVAGRKESEIQAPAEEKTQAEAEQEKKVSPEPAALLEMDFSENIPKKADGPKKTIRLLCKGTVRCRVQEYFGSSAGYKEKNSGDFVVTAEISEGPSLYGWLASLGKDVHIMKPKKTAQAYRDYLKAIAREYKGI